MSPYGRKIYQVSNNRDGERLAVIAQHWRDALDIYARIHGMDDYQQWLESGRPAITVFDHHGAPKSQRRLI